MKKITKIFAGIALGVMFTANVMAQTEKGRVMIGGSIGFNSNKVEDDDDATSTINVSPNIGYFFIDNLAGGLNVDFFSEKYGDVTTSGLGIGPFVRYYLPMKVFGQLGYDFQSAKVDVDGESGTASGGLLKISVGYGIFLNDNVAIEPMIYYGMGSFKPEGADESTKSSDFGVMIGVQAFIGGGK